MNIVIVDDDKNYIKVIEEKIKPFISCRDKIHLFTEPNDYKKFLNSSNFVDIVIMDIELGGTSGIDLAVQTNYSSPYARIIYLTSYIKYVSDVYQSDHIYFIEKNHIDDYLPMAIKKAKKVIEKNNNTILSISWNKVRSDILIKDIIYIERKKRTSIIYTSEKNYKTAHSLNILVKMLNEDFVIIHKSYLVNMNYIKTINSFDIILKNNKSIPLSRSHRQMVKNKYTDFLIRH